MPKITSIRITETDGESIRVIEFNDSGQLEYTYSIDGEDSQRINAKSYPKWDKGLIRKLLDVLLNALCKDTASPKYEYQEDNVRKG